MNSLNLEATKKILANAGKLAEDEGYAPMAFVVIDAGGNMVAAHRQDGATHWRIGIADGKAQCALGMGTSSRKIAEVAEARPAFVQSLMAMTGGKVVTSPGGVRILDDSGATLGAIGVSGDLPDRDEACAFAGIKAAGLRRENKMSVTVGGLEVTGELKPGYTDVLNHDALHFVGRLVRTFASQLDTLQAMRQEKQARWDAGEMPGFLPETRNVRESDWTIKGIPEDLLDRRVEITGPVDRKMIINALNADVKVFMADFEDATTPTWDNLIEGQINLRDAVRGQISFTDEARGKSYEVGDDPSILIARVRGLHLPEKHVLMDGKPIPGCLLDFGLYFHHNAQALLHKGSGPYFYVPKIQSHLEARWWNDVFTAAEKEAGLDVGTIKATFLIETLPAVFEMEEILYELRDHVVALNCGRWDYIFSYIKTLKTHADRILPDRQAVTMDQPFLDAYSRLLIKTCHKRGAMAMGGMSAFIPSKDEEQNAVVRQKVTDDKTREAANGHDGTWVAHPGLAEIVNPIFKKALGKRPNQLDVMRGDDEEVTAANLLEPSTGDRTETGMRHNIRVALQYIEAWISGNGCVPIYGLMEDAATAEISRASIWQWIRHSVSLSNGRVVTKELFETLLAEEIEAVKEEIGADVFASGRFTEAAKLFSDMTTSEEFGDFLTLPAYEMI